MVSYTSSQTGPAVRQLADRMLKGSGALWFVIAAIGQLLFVYYILVAYVPATVMGQYAQWDETGIIKGYEAGDGFGNFMFISHVLLASIMTLAGVMQLTEPLRRLAPTLHRFSGRIFLVLSVYLSLGGVWMVWVRGTRPNDVVALATSIESLLILIFAGFALHFARKRQIDRHRPWALRLFMAASGVWFLRVFYSAWFILVGPVGVSRSMDGWYDVTVAYGAVLVPLAVLELYLIAQASGRSAIKFVSVGVNTLAAGVTAIGVVGATLIMWSPHF